jgi:hypothetical protein
MAVSEEIAGGMVTGVEVVLHKIIRERSEKALKMTLAVEKACTNPRHRIGTNKWSVSTVERLGTMSRSAGRRRVTWQAKLQSPLHANKGTTWLVVLTK